MPLGRDQQYDLSWSERDKIKRRLELKKRLKLEGVKKRYDPFMQMRGELFTDPAVDRYSDLRKRGRMPGAPLKPSLFYGMVATILVPIYLLAKAIDWERRDWLKACANGDIPYSARESKALT